MHWSAYEKLLEKWKLLIIATNPQKFEGTVKITYTRSSVVAPDWDNLAASFKPIGDALVACGVIEDDNPSVVVEFIPRWQKAKNNNNLTTTIEIERG